MDIQIKKVNLKNTAPILFDLYTKIFIKDYHTKITDEQTLLKNYSHCPAFIAYDSSKPIGLLIYDDKSDFVLIDEFGLLPEYQRKGIGS